MIEDLGEKTQYVKGKWCMIKFKLFYCSNCIDVWNHFSEFLIISNCTFNILSFKF